MATNIRTPGSRGWGDKWIVDQSPGIQHSTTDSSSANVSELPFPIGFNPLCPTCSFLAGKYGPDDIELICHLDNYGGVLSFTDSPHYISGDDDNPNSHEYYPAN
jgi:hypothetical protein